MIRAWGIDSARVRSTRARVRGACGGQDPFWTPGTGSGDLVLIDLEATELNKFVVFIVFYSIEVNETH